MRIAFLCKRKYTGKDVITDRYGRLYETCRQLAESGHDVRGYCLDYHGAGAGEWTHPGGAGTLTWESHSLGRLRIPALFGYPQRLLRRLQAFEPEVVIGASDIPHVALAVRLARRMQLPCAIDLYDNFEGFGQARIPGFVAALKHAARNADLVTVVSDPLKRKVEAEYGVHCSVRVVPNGIDRDIFKPSDRTQARRQLGLPVDAKLLGTAGALTRSKGVGVLFDAWPALADTRSDLHLVLAGPTEAGLPLPQGDRVHYLGQLDHSRVGVLFAALDVGVVTVRDTPFGRYCFPQKACEMMACDLPLIAGDVGVMTSLLADMPQLLYQADDAAALANAALQQVEYAVRPTFPTLDWRELLATIEPDLQRIAALRSATYPARRGS